MAGRTSTAISKRKGSGMHGREGKDRVLLYRLWERDPKVGGALSGLWGLEHHRGAGIHAKRPVIRSRQSWKNYKGHSHYRY